MPPPTMATLKAFDLEDSVVEALAPVIVDSVLVVLEVEVVVVVMEVEVILNFDVICVKGRRCACDMLLLVLLYCTRSCCVWRRKKKRQSQLHIYTQSAGPGPESAGCKRLSVVAERHFPIMSVVG